MSKWAKILWLVSGLSLTCLVTIRYIFGGWTTDWLFVPLGMFLLTAIVAVVVDYRFYLEPCQIYSCCLETLRPCKSVYKSESKVFQMWL